MKQVDQLCDGCLTGKDHHMLFSEQVEYRAKRALEIVHGDLCGPITPTTLRGNKMFLLHMDDFSRFMWSVLLHSKDEAPEAIKRVCAKDEEASGKKISCLHIDQGELAPHTSLAPAHHVIFAATKWGGGAL
jgi:hypothetical protein